MTLSFTPRFHLAVPDFLSEPWHAEFAAAMESIDQALFTAIVAQDTTLWGNDRLYKAGDIIIDPTTGTLYASAEDHTSSSVAVSPTFAIEIVSFPNRWTSFAVTAASQIEAELGDDNSKYMTPLRTKQAIFAQSPTPGIASEAQATEGTDNTQIMTPRRVKEATNARLATQVQAEGATVNDVLMTPLRVAQQLAATGIAGGAQIAFSAHKNGVDQIGIFSGIATKVTFATELYDLDSRYDIANSRWTPPNGAVSISAFVYLSAGVNAATTPVLAIHKNGVLYKSTRIVTASTSDGIGVDVDDVANGTDYYEVFVTLSSPGTGTISGVATSSYFMGHFLGEVGAVTLGTGQIGFRAHKNAVDQNIPNSVLTKVTFGTEEYDQGARYDPVLSRWTPPTGLVHLDASAYLSSGATTGSCNLAIFKNGVNLKQGVIIITAAGAAASQVSVDDSASGTDYYEVYVFVPSGGVSVLNGSLTNTWFGGHFLGGSRGATGAVGPPGPDGAIAAPAINSGRLRVVSPTLLSFTPYNGDRVKVNGVLQQISGTGIVGLANTGAFVNGVAASSLLANTTYFIYVFMNGGVLTADFSTTGHATSVTPGNVGTEIRIGDDTRTLIGMVRTAGTGGVQFLDNVTNRLVINWFNRRNRHMRSPEQAGNPGTNFVEFTTTRLNFLNWGDETVWGSIWGYGYTDVDTHIWHYLTLDAAANPQNFVARNLMLNHAGWYNPAGASGSVETTEGFHTLSYVAQCGQNMNGSAACSAMIQG